MYKEFLTKLKQFDRKKITATISIVLAVTLLTILVVYLTRPQRSIAAYCRVYKQERIRLSAMSNDNNPYPSGLFNVSVSDAGQIAASLGKLDQAAPKSVEPNVSSLRKLYQDIHNNPSHAVNDSLNGGSLDDSLNAWTQQDCTNKAL